MKAVLTGGTGFIGGRLAGRLIDERYEVRSLARETSDVAKLRDLGADICYGSLSDPGSLRNLVQDGDVVYHIAALVSDWGPRDKFFKVNVEGTRNMLDASLEAGVKRFVHMSTSTVVWKSDFWKPHRMTDIDESHPYPDTYNDYYNESKAEAEKLVLQYAEETELQTVIIRPSNVWGAGDTVILPRIAKAAEMGILFPMGSWKKWSSPCYIDNLLEGLILAGRNEKAPGNIYFINDGVKIEHEEFVSKQLEAAGVDWEPKFSIPYSLAYGVAYLLERWGCFWKSEEPPVLTRFAVAALAGSRSYSIEKARRELGYEPTVGFEEGLKQLKAWVESVGGIDSLIDKLE